MFFLRFCILNFKNSDGICFVTVSQKIKQRRVIHAPHNFSSSVNFGFTSNLFDNIFSFSIL